jgi:hypothetical protein
MTRTTRWASLRVHGEATAFVWILPTRAGAWVDLASDGWLEALEEASAPRVVPPDISPPCGIAGGVEIEGDDSHEATLAPDGLVAAPDGAALTLGLAMWGLLLPRDLAAAIDAAAASGDAFVALHFTVPPGSATYIRTRTVRITEDEPALTSPSVAGLTLTGGDGSSPAIIAHALFGQPTAWVSPAGTQPSLSPSSILWRPDGSSTYSAARDALLESMPGSWLEETAGHGILFQATSVPGSAQIAAVTDAYFARAGKYGDAADDVHACAASALAVAASSSTVALACPPGALATVGPAGRCQEVVAAGEIAPDVLRCGGIADDLALALSGLAPGQAYLTRARSVIPAGLFGHDTLLQPASDERGPVVSAAGYTVACVPQGGGGQGVSVVAGGWGTGALGFGVTAGASGGTEAPPDSVTDPGSGGAGGDDSSGDSSSGESCGGDSSSSTDSSTDSSSSGEGCGGGTSSGSESSGSDTSSSDSCSGSGGSGSSSDSNNCSTGGRPTRGRSYVSRVAIALAFLAGALRRRTRRRAAEAGSGWRAACR